MTDFFMQMCTAVCLGAVRNMQNKICTRTPRGKLVLNHGGLVAAGPMTLPAGCPLLCKAASWTHGTWPPCSGSCSRRIRCPSARESRPTHHGNCRHNQKCVQQDILRQCSSAAVIADTASRQCEAQHGGIYCLLNTLGCSPFKVVELYFLSEELQEFYKGRTLVVVSEQFFLWSLQTRKNTELMLDENDLNIIACPIHYIDLEL